MAIPSIFAPHIVDDPYAFYRQLREEAPVHWDEEWRAWLVTRHADVTFVLKSAATFASRRFTGRSALPEDLAEQLRPLAARFLLFQDPPDHSRVRALVNKAFTPRAVNAMRERVVSITHRLLDRAASRDVIDVIEDLAFPLPAEVICAMLGTPLNDVELVRGWSMDLEAFFGAGKTDEALGRRALTSFLAMREYFKPLFAERRTKPRDDLLTALVSAEENGDVLGEDELFATTALLFFAGHHTTANTIGNGLLALFEHPDMLARVRQQPSLLATGIDELIRYDSAVQMLVRTAKEDITVGGQKVAAKQRVVAILGAANRDPAVFPEPDELRFDRPDLGKLTSFGHGIHYCLGAALARLEGHIALQALFERFPGLRPADEPPKRIPAVVFRGLLNLPVALRK